MKMVYAVPVVSNNLEPPLAATEACGTEMVTQTQSEAKVEACTLAQQPASCYQPQITSVCGSAVTCHRDMPVVADYHDGTCEMHSASHMRPPPAEETSLQPTIVTERTTTSPSGRYSDELEVPETLGAASGLWTDQTEALGQSGMMRLECGIEPQADSKISRSEQILAHCDTQILSVVDHDHHDHEALAAARSVQPEDSTNLTLPEDHHAAAGGPARVGLELEASGKRTWSRGKKISEADAYVRRRLHGTTTISVANVPASMTFFKLGKPTFRRQVDRDYSRPGKFRGVRYRGKGRYSAELKVKEKRRWLGIFSSAEEAARTFDRAAFEVRGKAAKLNFPELIEGAEVHGQGKDGLPRGNYPEGEGGGVFYDSICNTSDETNHGGTHWRSLSSSLPYGQGEGLGTTSSTLHGPQQILQQNSFPALLPQAEGGAYVRDDKHTMEGSHRDTVTCASQPFLPPISRRAHPYTHPLTARSPLWPDLDVDPLQLLPPALPLPAAVPEADSGKVPSPADQLELQRSAAEAAAAATSAATVTAIMAWAQGMIMMAQQQQQQQQQQQSAKNSRDSGVLPVAGGVLPGHLAGGVLPGHLAGGVLPGHLACGVPGGIARDLGATLQQASLAVLLDKWAASIGIASSSGGGGSSFGPLAATIDVDAPGETNLKRLHIGSSTTNPDPRETSNDLPDSCAAKSR